MDDIEDTNYKFNSQDIENIWYIFFCLADSTFSSVDVSYGKKGPYMLSGETMMSICKTLETIDFCCYRDAYSDAYSIKFHSSDYLDALEMEMKPQEGSQYWVCPIIVEYMNDRFDKKLLQYIQNNEGNGMQFMAEYYNQNKG